MAGKLTPRFTVITLGVSDMRRSIAFYTELGFERRMKATGRRGRFLRNRRHRDWLVVLGLAER